MSQRITRLAPSPTGALHLGNARTFLVNWLMARQAGWRIIMRIEDLDTPRTKTWATKAALEDLEWLGVDWDGDIVYQSDRTEIYNDALNELIRRDLAYPCVCSRKDVETAASAPHAEDAMVCYPGTCRGKYRAAEHAVETTNRPVAYRVVTDGKTVRVHDQFAGDFEYEFSRIGGDFVVFRKSGLAAYQLAVTVDDAEAGVNAIVRGDDLLDSAARQIHLRHLLGLTPEVEYWHLPLVIGEDGRRLAKRHGDTRLSYYREHGTPIERIWGLLGFWSGAIDRRRPAGIQELLDKFRPDRMPKGPAVFTAEDDQFLLND
ncbi:MAG: tRNA glutamyl-Q(34) synthetase GluQRS [Phycisphaerae bacterium]